MKIISPWSDYYDKLRCYTNPAYCSDDFTYIRKTSDPIEIDDLSSFYYSQFNFEYINSFRNNSFKNDIHARYIGFCGSWYILYIVSEYSYNGYARTTNNTYYFDGKKALRAAIDQKEMKKQAKPKNISTPQLIENKINSTYKHKQQNLKEAVTCLDKLDLFKTHNTPVLLVTPGSTHNSIQLILNPSLKELHFYKYMEGNIAYQELEMFLGSELMPKDNPDQITNNTIKILNHGFDINTSFRKKPTKAEKREKRKTNKLRKRTAKKE